eukprot:m.2594 g.2594  ORF g.2594 m.2594 type:complete len:156 (+) comp3132_c0_seq1:2-469(+)
MCKCFNGYSGRHCGVKPPSGPLPCSSSPCLNDGVCGDVIDSNSHTYVCDCKNGYSGQNCGVKPTTPAPLPCTSSPCMNGGVCKNVLEYSDLYTFICECKNGYTGSRCRVDPTTTTTPNPQIPLKTMGEVFAGVIALAGLALILWVVSLVIQANSS